MRNMQFLLLTLYTWFIYNLLSDEDVWTDGNSVLPRADSQSAIGFWGNSIFIIGGINYRNQLVEYDITSDAVIDYSQNFTSDDIYGTVQYYTQKGNLLYIIDNNWNDNSYQFSVFNLKTKHFVNGWKDVTISTISYSKSCLASSNKYLFVVGGSRYDNYAIKDCQIFDLSSNTWKNTNYMKVYRSSLGCIVHPSTNTLYAFGGYDWTHNWEVFDSIESLSIVSDPSTNSWIKSNEILLHPTAGARAVITTDYIVIIGGYSDYYNQNNVLNEIQLIDIVSGVVQSGGYLSYSVSQTSAIIVNNIMYSFGGQNHNGYLDKWQYSILPAFCEWSGHGKKRLKKKCAEITEKSVCESNGNCDWIHNTIDNILFIKGIDNNNKNYTYNSSNYGLIILVMIFILSRFIILKCVSYRNTKEKYRSRVINSDEQIPLLANYIV
eukprot:210969_1